MQEYRDDNGHVEGRPIRKSYLNTERTANNFYDFSAGGFDFTFFQEFEVIGPIEIGIHQGGELICVASVGSEDNAEDQLKGIARLKKSIEGIVKRLTEEDNLNAEAIREAIDGLE
ncbi:MAG: hypothetical protein AAB893_03960 [Patescibacteria group bacterium]